jgi:hypothetical protein
MVPVMFVACQMVPRVSQWAAPEPLTVEQVFQAALRAGAQNGFSITSQDRQSGIVTMERQVADKRIFMALTLRKPAERVQVYTTIRSDKIVIAGLYEEITRNFYVYLFRELQITDPAQRNVDIKEAQ